MDDTECCEQSIEYESKADEEYHRQHIWPITVNFDSICSVLIMNDIYRVCTITHNNNNTNISMIRKVSLSDYARKKTTTTVICITQISVCHATTKQKTEQMRYHQHTNKQTHTYT